MMQMDRRMVDYVISEQPYHGFGPSNGLIQDLKTIRNPADRIGFYPSSGIDIDRVMDLPCDTIIFSDYHLRASLPVQGYGKNISPLQKFYQLGIEIIKESNDYIFGRRSNKFIYFFFLDNNEVLKLINLVFGNLNIFVGVVDGCGEGGNYECVNNLPFLEKVVQLASPNEMDIYIDHSAFLDHYPQYIFSHRIIKLVGSSPLYFSNFQFGPTRHYRVTTHTPVKYVWTHKQVKLTVEFDSILNHYGELDGIICSPLCRKMTDYSPSSTRHKILTQQPYFFRPSESSKWTAIDSLKLALSMAEKNHWTTIGITAFGEGNHQGFLEILREVVVERHLWVRLFHLDDDDFSDLISYMTLV